MSSIINCNDEALMRNQFMIKHYGKLPSYCLWSEYAIMNEREVDRLNWWLDFQKECNNELKNDIDNFMDIFYT